MSIWYFTECINRGQGKARGALLNKTNSGQTIEPEILVLLSGGLDSCACVDFYREMERPVEAVFVDYGQRAVKYERQAARAIAKHYNINLHEIRLSPKTHKNTGEIKFRNLFLLSLALMESSDYTRGVVLGVHAGTQYWDCSSEFIKSLQEMIIYKYNNIKILTPFINWNKNEIIQYVIDRKIPYKITYSCENGKTDGCGVCLSCIDRMRLANVST